MASLKICFVVFVSCVCLAWSAPNLEDENFEVEEMKVLFAESGKNVTANRGDTVTFSCEVTAENGTLIPASDESVISIWLKDNKVQMAGTQRLSRNPRLSIDDRNLILADVDMEDAGVYSCQLSTWGQPTLEYHLIVNTPPSVKAEKSKIVATSGDDVVLSCTAEGSPKPQITWRKKDYTMAKGDASLTLEQVSHSQAGKYICVADNGVGEPAKATIELDVMYKPEIKIDKGWIHSGENNQAELTCVIHGQPSPMVKWFRDGVELQTDSPHWTQTKVEGNTYTLELKNLKREHFGMYECRASNSIGRAEATIELSGVAKEAEFTSTPNGPEEDSYRLQWTVESYSPIKEYLLKYRQVNLNDTDVEDDEEWAAITVSEEKESNDVAAGHHHEHEYVLKALDKATEYEVSLQVVNTFGSNRPSKFRFATLGSTVSTWKSGTSSVHSFGLQVLALVSIVVMLGSRW